jgi:hypothetical protein
LSLPDKTLATFVENPTSSIAISDPQAEGRFSVAYAALCAATPIVATESVVDSTDVSAPQRECGDRRSRRSSEK